MELFTINSFVNGCTVCFRVHREAEAGACGVDHHRIHEFMDQASVLEEEPRVVRKKRVSRTVLVVVAAVAFLYRHGGLVVKASAS